MNKILPKRGPELAIAIIVIEYLIPDVSAVFSVVLVPGNSLLHLFGIPKPGALFLIAEESSWNYIQVSNAVLILNDILRIKNQLEIQLSKFTLFFYLLCDQPVVKSQSPKVAPVAYEKF